MRAVSFLALALFANFGAGALFGTPLLIAKKKSSTTAPTGIVMKAPAPTPIDAERVELEVRSTPEPAPAEADKEEAAPAPLPKPAARIASSAASVSPKPAAAPSPEPSVEPPFASLVSARVDELPMCRRGGPEGPGMAEVLFLPEGGAKVSLTEPYARTETGACIARRLGRDARAFEGKPVLVRVRFSL